jgi:gamma-glutamylcysteine synthetase
MDLTLQEAIYQKYIAPTERKAGKYVGVELELPLVNLSRRPVNIRAVQEIVAGFAERFHFSVQIRDDNGHLYSMTEPVSGDNLSFDCSFNTLELSFGKEENIVLLFERFVRYYEDLQAHFRKIGHQLTGLGIHPYYKYNDYEPIANDRYRMLYHHLQSYRDYPERHFHHIPHFGMLATASQVQLDVEKDNIVQTLQTMDRLEPFKAVLFANSWLDSLPDLLISRDFLWGQSTQGYNPHNFGMYGTDLADLDEYIEYVAGQSMYCVGKQGRYFHFKPIPLREYVKTERITGQFFADGAWHTADFRPEISDIAHLRTFKFSDLTYRGTIEYRSACEQPISAVFSHAAFHAGLAEELDALTELLDSDTVLYHHGYTAPELRELLTHRELPAFIDRKAFSAKLQQILELAQSGLQKRGLGEEAFLEPLFDRAERLTNPASEYLIALEQGTTIVELIGRYAALDTHILARKELL